MNQPPHMQIEGLLHRLDHLKRDGRLVRDRLALGPTEATAMDLAGPWQRACAATISQLSGGSKTHWLSRAYNDAFLLPSGDGPLVMEARPVEITDRILGVLDQAAASLRQSDPHVLTAPAAAARTVRFDFVRDSELRAQIERVYRDGQAAGARGDLVLALVSLASVLETVVTDALTSAVRRGRLETAPGDGQITNWSFDDRITAAERAGLISACCARLPASARRYRDLLDPDGALPSGHTVAEREVRLTAQVLTIVIRDLSPGR